MLCLLPTDVNEQTVGIIRRQSQRLAALSRHRDDIDGIQAVRQISVQIDVYNTVDSERLAGL